MHVAVGRTSVVSGCSGGGGALFKENCLSVLALLGFTWLYLALLGFTWLYLALLGFTWLTFHSIYHFALLASLSRFPQVEGKSGNTIECGVGELSRRSL